jgi:hypothetical protein
MPVRVVGALVLIMGTDNKDFSSANGHLLIAHDLARLHNHINQSLSRLQPWVCDTTVLPTYSVMEVAQHDELEGASPFIDRTSLNADACDRQLPT